MSRANNGRGRGKVAERGHEDVEREEEGVTMSSIPFESESSLGSGKIIDLFTQSFGAILSSETLNQHIQSVKSCLYERDYIGAFDNNDKRFAYAARWTPARALAYSSLFGSLAPIVELLGDKTHKTNVLTIGGGAGSEVVGLASVFCRLKEYHSTSESSVSLTIVDIADWSTVVNAITKYVKSNWIYNSACFESNFIHEDILQAQTDFSSQHLITLLFTTNELFAEKRKETMNLLNTMNRDCKPGTILLIAESAGSYSHITVGTKKFPVQFLIDMTLIGRPGANDGPWELVDQSDSCWYRMDLREIDYPMKLENMRFFYRLYRKK